ncbi:MAG TPA: phospholipid carrier-dependent glycosyltransferase, partial [Anaerolineales bacterium]|nr:phospholipid carrier-dependent glycosyltransferase [Anaerolineales bacterium]
MSKLPPLLADILLVLILLLGAYLRFVGINWDEDQHLHPDERFLTMVESAIEPVHSLGEYFDTARSSLNPANKGFGFFVYGTLPIFIVRYVADALGKTGYGEVHLVGRQLSALADVLLVLLVYWVGKRLYGRKVGLLAAAFSALAVMQIQQSHFFTVDNFFNLFTFAAVAVAVHISLDERPLRRLTPRFLAFGLAYGAAMAAKISAFPVAVLLPVALLVRWARLSPAQRREEGLLGASLLALAGGLSLLAFRVFQPYAFRGPHFWNFGLNPQWLNNLRELKAQASGHADFPPAMQWARRPVWFAVQNLVLWGLGLPLGLSALAALVGMGFRLRRGDWTRHTVLWAWTALYLVWQSLIWNPTMRYLLPVYPGLAVLAAWGWVRLAETRRRAWGRTLAWAGALGVVALTFLWAWGFSRIYPRPHPRIAASRWIYTHIPGPFTLTIQTPDGSTAQPVRAEDRCIKPDEPLEILFVARTSGTVTHIRIFRLVGPDTGGEPLTLSVELAPMDGAEPQRAGRAQGDFALTGEEHPVPVDALLPLDQRVYLEEGQTYRLTVRVNRGAVKVQGAFIANETSWDDGLPLRVDGYDGFGGIYQGLNFEMYWDDNEDKRQRFYDILNQADVLLITSSRQWGSLPRLPERFPLVSAYYRHLLGCSAGMSIETCYNIAQVGTFAGDLGYDLVAVFQNAPGFCPRPSPWAAGGGPGGRVEGAALAPLSLRDACLTVNDQFAEEAFTVYDHPKVFVFRKRADYDPAQVRAVLGAVDLRYVVHVLPGEAPPHPANLLLPPDRLTQQQAGGTWRDLFPPQSPLNRWPGLAAVAWYAFIALLGWLAVPLMRPAFRALGDGGYPLARLAGMLLFAYGAWLLGSAGIPVGRGTLLGVLGILLLASGAAAWRQRKDLGAWFRQRKGDIFRVEVLFLAFFLLDLFIRWMNPDLWHPWKGGEKPMDFAYFNAVLRSSTFPPYDPWFAGGYINYYYWGFVLVGMLVKLLGIRPEVAYNLILPTLFAGVALGAYAVARYLYLAGGEALSGRASTTGLSPSAQPQKASPGSRVLSGGRGPESKDALSGGRSPKSKGFAVGLAGAVGMALLGNLGTVRMIFHGLARLASPTGSLEGVSLFHQLGWAALGLVQVLFQHAHLPYGIGDWYWIPSRAISAPGDVEPITEFPFFTFLYA